MKKGSCAQESTTRIFFFEDTLLYAHFCHFWSEFPLWAGETTKCGRNKGGKYFFSSTPLLPARPSSCSILILILNIFFAVTGTLTFIFTSNPTALDHSSTKRRSIKATRTRCDCTHTLHPLLLAQLPVANSNILMRRRISIKSPRLV